MISTYLSMCLSLSICYGNSILTIWLEHIHIYSGALSLICVPNLHWINEETTIIALFFLVKRWLCIIIHTLICLGMTNSNIKLFWIQFSAENSKDYPRIHLRIFWIIVRMCFIRLVIHLMLKTSVLMLAIRYILKDA